MRPFFSCGSIDEDKLVAWKYKFRLAIECKIQLLLLRDSGSRTILNIYSNTDTVDGSEILLIGWYGGYAFFSCTINSSIAYLPVIATSCDLQLFGPLMIYQHFSMFNCCDCFPWKFVAFLSELHEICFLKKPAFWVIRPETVSCHVPTLRGPPPHPRNATPPHPKRIRPCLGIRKTTIVPERN